MIPFNVIPSPFVILVPFVIPTPHQVRGKLQRESQRDKLQQEIQNKKWILHQVRDDKFNNPDKIFTSGLKIRVSPAVVTASPERKSRYSGFDS